MSNFVLVIDTEKNALDPVHPGKARRLLKAGKAAIYRKFPFTIILKCSVPDTKPEPCRLKIDPGAKTTGLALLQGTKVVWAAELTHRGFRIKDALESRRSLRRGRRNRKTRYRQARFLNRTRAQGWLPPSLQSRVENVMTWVGRLQKLCPIDSLSQELVRFDTQKMLNREISSIEYQQGTLLGFEAREYILEKYNRTCQYCGVKDVPLEMEHIVPRSKGGSDRVSNLTLSCRQCNEKKGNKSVEEFLKGKPEVLKRILVNAKKPLRDAAAVNATRWALFNRLKDTGLEIEVGSGGLTKYNRTRQKLDKTHWHDAACVGKSTPEKLEILTTQPLLISAKGHGVRQRVVVDKFGFPKQHRGRFKLSHGFKTGDLVNADIPKGKYAGCYRGLRIAVRTKPTFALYPTKGGKQFDAHCKYLKAVHKADGYAFSYVSGNSSDA